MSSLRNAVQRRNHKERAQPLERQKWGILEKHKDYSLRAKDFNEKRKRLRILREKARDRNPDEFHFAMMSSRTQDGRMVTDRGNTALSMDVVKLLKTQDAGYLRTMVQRTRKERERLEEEMRLGEGEEEDLQVLKGDGEGEKRGKHTVFVDLVQQQKSFEPGEWFGTDRDGLEKSYNRPRRRSEGVPSTREEDDAVQHPENANKSRSQRAKDAEGQAVKEAHALRRRRQKAQEVRRIRLEALRARERDLQLAEQELENQRAKMTNTLGGVNKEGVKFKVRERKR